MRAADTEYDWPWYGGLVGAYFRSHPAIQAATIRVEDRAIRPPRTSAAAGGGGRLVRLPQQPP